MRQLRGFRDGWKPRTIPVFDLRPPPDATSRSAQDGSTLKEVDDHTAAIFGSLETLVAANKEVVPLCNWREKPELLVHDNVGHPFFSLLHISLGECFVQISASSCSRDSLRRSFARVPKRAFVVGEHERAKNCTLEGASMEKEGHCFICYNHIV